MAKAYRWQEQLESGQYASLEELAAADGVDRTYVSRILRLTSLSPEIVEAILNGNEPKGISLAKLHKEAAADLVGTALGLTTNRHRWYAGRGFYVPTAMTQASENAQESALQRKLPLSRHFRRVTR